MHEPRDAGSPLDQIADQRWEDQLAQFTDKITEPTHQMLMRAHNEAKRFDHLAVSTEHLLLALLRESDAGGALVLRQLGVDLLRVHDHLLRRLGPPGGRGRAGVAGLTPLAMQAVLLGWEEARRLGRDRADSEHLLLGLWREGDGGAGQVLASLSISLEQARLRVMQLRSEPHDSLVSNSGVTSDTTVTCQLDPRDLDAIDALVAAGGTTTRSEAVSWLVHAGIAVNASLFDTAHRTIADIQHLRDKVLILTQEAEENALRESAPLPESPTDEQE
jgi:ATP-dependent Clp protease ATP-binding subunit ClpA